MIIIADEGYEPLLHQLSGYGITVKLKTGREMLRQVAYEDWTRLEFDSPALRTYVEKMIHDMDIILAFITLGSLDEQRKLHQKEKE